LSAMKARNLVALFYITAVLSRYNNNSHFDFKQ